MLKSDFLYYICSSSPIFHQRDICIRLDICLLLLFCVLPPTVYIRNLCDVSFANSGLPVLQGRCHFEHLNAAIFCLSGLEKCFSTGL